MAKKNVEEQAPAAEKKPEKGAAAEAVATDDSKIDKVETIAQTKKIQKKYGKVGTVDIKRRDPYLPRSLEDKLRKEVPKMRSITPNDLAAKYDVSVSTMRKFLYTLEKEGILEPVTSSARLKVYNPK
jgi:ribosomal protein S25